MNDIGLAGAWQVGHEGAVRCLALSKCETFLYTGADDKQIFIWSLPSCSRIKTLSAHFDSVCSLAVSDAGDILCSGSGMRQGSALHYHPHAVGCAIYYVH